MILKWLLPPDGDDRSPYLCEVTFKRSECPTCGFQHELNATPPRRVYDLPFGDHPVILEFAEGYTRCPKTGEEVEYVAPDDHCTERLIRYLQRHHGQEPHRALAQRVGLTPSRVLRHQKEVEVPERQREVVNLGLDDLYLFKQRFVVATDLDTGKLLLLEPGAPMIEGKADQMDFGKVLAGLPTPKYVAVDMHREQLKAVKVTWPEAVVVIDKRHVLQTIDRDLIELVGDVVLVWRGQNSESFSVSQALRPFGAAAYPYLALRTLVLRRQALLTPADHAAWMLLRREGGEAQRLWEAYQWREALYDIYDERLTGREDFATELKRWNEEVRAWQKWVDKPRRNDRGNQGSRAPFQRILWVLEKYLTQCQAYGLTRLTNARTELVNARIRRYVRQGHRYAPGTLVALINRDLELSNLVRAAGRLARKEEENKVEQNTLPGVSEMAPAFVPRIEPPFLKKCATRTATPRQGRTSRHRPVRHKSIELPEHVWAWLHSVTDSKRRQSQRWSHVLLAAAPSADWWAWQLLCQGKRGEEGFDVTDTQLTQWRLSVLIAYFSMRAKEQAMKRHRAGQTTTLSPSEDDPLFLLHGLKVAQLVVEEPALAGEFARVCCVLASTSHESLIRSDQELLKTVWRWHRERSGLALLKSDGNRPAP